MTATYRITPGQTVNGTDSAARAIPASLLVATQREIYIALRSMQVGGVVSFEVKHGRTADMGGATRVAVQRIA